MKTSHLILIKMYGQVKETSVIRWLLLQSEAIALQLAANSLLWTFSLKIWYGVENSTQSF